MRDGAKGRRNTTGSAIRPLRENSVAEGPHNKRKSDVVRPDPDVGTAASEYRRALFNNLHDAILVHDLNGRVVDVNEKMLQMYRLSREEAIGLSIVSDYSSPDNPPLLAYQPILWERVLAGEGQLFEWKARRPTEGSIFDVEVSLTKLSLPEGDFILATTRDITERKRVERELVATKNYLNTVFNNIHDAIFVHDVNGKVVDVNDKLLEMYGFTREEAIGLSIIPDYAILDDDVDQPALWKKAIAGENQFFECRGRRPKDGYEFDAEIFLTRLSLPEGDFILANVRDITKRKTMEKQLIKEKETFFSVLEDNPHGIAVINHKDRYLYVNPEFTAITGYTLADIPASQDWIHEIYGEADGFEKALESKERGALPEVRGRGIEARIVCKSGEKKYVEFRITFLGDRRLIVLTDVTARKRIEEALHAEKQNFQTLSEGSPVGMVMIGGDDGWTFKYTNPKFREIFGHGASDIPDLDAWLARVYPDPHTRRRAAPIWMNLLKGTRQGKGRAYVRKLSTKNGMKKHIKFIPVQLETAEILMTCWDITKNMEAAQRIKERNLVLEVLNDIMASVGGSLSLSEILLTLKRVFAEKLKIHGGAFFLHSAVSSKINMERWWGIADPLKEDFETFALGCYGAGKVIHDDDVTLARNQLDRLGPHITAPFQKLGWHGYLCISLIAEGEMEGMIFLVDRARDRFNDDQIPFYKALGQQIGVAIQNARLFAQVRQSHAQMKALSLKLVDVQEAERRYIARELHDEIGQELTGLKLALEMNALKKGDGLTPETEQARSVVNRLMGLVRELSLKLRPAMLDDLGLLPTLLWHFERFTNQTNVHVAFKRNGMNGTRFPLQLETAIYRIVQEALTNVARHAKVSEVIVRLWSDDRMVGTQIEDFGIGFDAESVLHRRRTNGLDGMRERAMLLGGTFTVESRLGVGTRLTAELPINVGGGDS
jgi:PAS domain S-box-containing protein